MTYPSPFFAFVSDHLQNFEHRTRHHPTWLVAAGVAAADPRPNHDNLESSKTVLREKGQGPKIVTGAASKYFKMLQMFQRFPNKSADIR